MSEKQGQKRAGDILGNEINRIGLGIMEVRKSRHADCNKLGQ
jgi:hypothetical protein